MTADRAYTWSWTATVVVALLQYNSSEFTCSYANIRLISREKCVPDWSACIKIVNCLCNVTLSNITIRVISHKHFVPMLILISSNFTFLRNNLQFLRNPFEWLYYFLRFELWVLLKSSVSSFPLLSVMKLQANWRIAKNSNPLQNITKWTAQQWKNKEKFDVNGRRIWIWETNVSIKRKKSIQFEDIEQNLFDWFISMGSGTPGLTGNHLLEKAQEIRDINSNQRIGIGIERLLRDWNSHWVRSSIRTWN